MTIPPGTHPFRGLTDPAWNQQKRNETLWRCDLNDGRTWIYSISRNGYMYSRLSLKDFKEGRPFRTYFYAPHRISVNDATDDAVHFTIPLSGGGVDQLWMFPV